jgi:hypothetical protein
MLNERTKDFKQQSKLTIRNFGRNNNGVYSCKAKRNVVKWYVQDKVRLVMRGK